VANPILSSTGRRDKTSSITTDTTKSSSQGHSHRSYSPNGVDRKDAGFYIVCAKNRFGIYQQTVELYVADVADPPRGVKVSDVSRDSVSLSWKVPANDGGSRETSYVVEKCPTTADRWERVAQARDTHYTITCSEEPGTSSES
jgi:hypothetical protein